jgi:prolipoprotein diacylglyceryl transferase
MIPSDGVLITVEPVILRAGPFTLRWSSLLLLAAVGTGLWLTIRHASRLGFSSRTVLELSSWAILLGFIGARLFHVVEYWEYYLTRPAEAPRLAVGGLSVWGGIVVGGLTVWTLCRRSGLSFPRLADSAAPGLALAEAIGRLAAFVNGDGQGRTSELPWATHYSSKDALTPDYGIARHPAQVYQGLADLFLFGLLWLLRDASLPAGSRFYLWLGLYGLSRAAIGLVRLDPPFLFGLQQSQLVAIAALALSVFAMIRAGSRCRVALAPPRGNRPWRAAS